MIYSFGIESDIVTSDKLKECEINAIKSLCSFKVNSLVRKLMEISH